MSLFTDVALPWLWPEEGGFTHDQGGDTNLGVTQAALDRFHANHPERRDVPTIVRDLTQATAVPVYELDYWNAVNADALPQAWALVAFDTAVNSGDHEAGVLLQGAVGFTDAADLDGVVGPRTVAAVAAAGERQLEEYLWLRLDYDRAAALHQEALGEPGLKSLPVWCKRVRALRTVALAQRDAHG